MAPSGNHAATTEAEEALGGWFAPPRPDTRTLLIFGGLDVTIAFIERRLGR
jgi:hypothetical protein